MAAERDDQGMTNVHVTYATRENLLLGTGSEHRKKKILNEKSPAPPPNQN